jgi:hypothetical protein
VSVTLITELEELEQILTKTSSVSDLIQLENAVRAVYQRAPDSARVVSLIGAIIRKRLEWQAASDFFLTMASKFPGALSLQYDGALTAIDAGNYKSGMEAIVALSSHLKSLGPRQLRGLWRAAPLVGLYHIALDAFFLALEKGMTPGSSGVEQRLKIAASNAADPVVESVGAISIGENCLPWQLCQRWGLRSSETMLDQESPFNLAQTMTDNVAQLFRDGLNPLIDTNLMSTGVDGNNGSLYPVNRTYNFDFNHERGPGFISDNYQRVIERYTDRISKIRDNAVKRPSVFVHFTERDGDLNGLVEAIKSFVKTDFRIVILDSWSGNRPKMRTSDNVVRYLKVNLPASDYRWFIPDHYDSAEGFQFEQRISGFIFDAMSELK